MKAPEKIYRTTLYLDNDRGETKWNGQPVAGAENIEYTRTDAFIEKAAEWLKKNADNYTWYDETEGESGMVDGFIEVFRDYMKGE